MSRSSLGLLVALAAVASGCGLLVDPVLPIAVRVPDDRVVVEEDRALDDRVEADVVDASVDVAEVGLDAPAVGDLGVDAEVGLDALDAGDTSDVSEVLDASEVFDAGDVGEDAVVVDAPDGSSDALSCGDAETVCQEVCVDTSRDPLFCGGCDTRCPPRANAVPTCVNGQCGFACNPGFADCNNDASDGCESALDDPRHCGRCDVACPQVVGGAPRCTNGTCGFECEMGRTRCGSQCVDTSIDARNCGVCNTSCLNADVCSDGRCGSQCQGPTTACVLEGRTLCIDLRNSVDHCGACGRRCPSGPNTVAVCDMGQCSEVCRTGFANCDGDMASNGCEVDTRTTRNHCGSCGNACPLSSTILNAAFACFEGRCRINTCAASFGDCDGTAANGCETSLLLAGSCGQCGSRCRALCSPVGGCLGQCAAGFSACGPLCVNFQNNPLHCGGCNVRCPSGVCQAARCMP